MAIIQSKRNLDYPCKSKNARMKRKPFEIWVNIIEAKRKEELVVNKKRVKNFQDIQPQEASKNCFLN